MCHTVLHHVNIAVLACSVCVSNTHANSGPLYVSLTWHVLPSNLMHTGLGFVGDDCVGDEKIAFAVSAAYGCHKHVIKTGGKPDKLMPIQALPLIEYPIGHYSRARCAVSILLGQGVLVLGILYLGDSLR